MLVVLALVFGAVAGTAAHFALPDRGLRGAAVGPLLGTVIGAATWTIMTWSGLGPDTAWIWLASILVPTLVSVVALRFLTRSRAAADARTRRELGIV